MQLFNKFELTENVLSDDIRKQIFDFIVKDKNLPKIFDDYYDYDVRMGKEYWDDIKFMLNIEDNYFLKNYNLTPLDFYENLKTVLCDLQDELTNIVEDLEDDKEINELYKLFNDNINILENHCKNIYSQEIEQCNNFNDDFKNILKKIYHNSPAEQFFYKDVKGNVYASNPLNEKEMQILVENLANPIIYSEISQKHLMNKNLLRNIDFQKIAPNFGIDNQTILQNTAKLALKQLNINENEIDNLLNSIPAANKGLGM